MIRIYKIEKFIPKTGLPVFQINEEFESGGRVVFLDPRNPSADELSNADEQFAAAQQAAIAELEQQLAIASAKIAGLSAALPWDRRIVDAAAFLARVTNDELLDLLSSSDPSQQQIAAMLREYKSHDWPILLDSPEMQEAIGYLTQSGAISPERAAELLRDSVQTEAYKPGE
jgi:hypothetical protein